MGTLNGNGFRPLEYYRQRYNERLLSPTVLANGEDLPLLFRLPHLPPSHGAYELLVQLDDVKSKGVGVYAVRFTVTSKHTGKEFTEGEWFDGVWNPEAPITYRGTLGGKPANVSMVDAIVYRESTKHEPERVLSVSRDQHLTLV